MELQLDYGGYDFGNYGFGGYDPYDLDLSAESIVGGTSYAPSEPALDVGENIDNDTSSIIDYLESGLDIAGDIIDILDTAGIINDDDVDHINHQASQVESDINAYVLDLMGEDATAFVKKNQTMFWLLGGGIIVLTILLIRRK